MDNLTEQLTSMLSDPEQLESIKKMARSMFGEGEGEKPPSSTPTPAAASAPALPDIPPEMLGGLMKALSVFRARSNDKNTAFLQALRPLLREDRRERVDTAIKLLHVFSALPALKESGVFNLI